MKNLIDIHSHTFPCSHDGIGTMEDMLKTAIEKKLSYYGFSNHVDFDYDESKFPDSIKDRMANGDSDEFFRDARILQNKHKKDINLLVGAEFGYAPDENSEKKYIEYYEKYMPDYVINSVHSIDGVDYGLADLSAGKSKVYSDYLDIIRKSLDAAYHYDIVGHIEYVVRYAPFEEKEIKISEFGKQIDDILLTIISKNKILEINSSTRKLNRYSLPSVEILQRYYELGGRNISFGSDAHDTNRILEKYDIIVETLKKIGFTYFTVPTKAGYVKVHFE